MRAADEPDEISKEALDALLLYLELYMKYKAQIARIEEMCSKNLAASEEAWKRKMKQTPLPPPSGNSDRDRLSEALRRLNEPQGAVATTTATATTKATSMQSPPAPLLTDRQVLKKALNCMPKDEPSFPATGEVSAKRSDSAQGDRCSHGEGSGLDREENAAPYRTILVPRREVIPVEEIRRLPRKCVKL
ncbi:hypothetical protein BU25DRAFT_419696 [Macroventuria anomochaeta]|uniref:Uncharacterized protein n=1 Tax=Macroventuria anomochaeta TaxID=301207 RepID=A0ACB6S900_9PLEO|nr:uncharacterized protein BU25DRAFT_419696 [Macroventuria anomochaeta]KAF2630055.1 hypothetical protein BU25DRAFT_419696 [Macroventuria anomochaeta]